MVGIYKFINNEDKVYIGYSKNIERRIKNHLKVYDIKDWVIVEECSEKELSLNYPSITQCCLGNYKTSGKFKWGYK